jgi:superfamily I DNA and RNA helicase
MADVVYGEQVLSGPLQELVSLFEKPGYDGTLYLGYPILSNVEGTVKVDGIYVSRDAGVVVFDSSHLEVSEADPIAIADVRTAQNRFFAAINSKLLESTDLLERRRLVVPITVVSISGNANFQTDEVIVSTVERVAEHVPNDAHLSTEKFRALNSVIERTATIRPQKKRLNVLKQNSRGAVLRVIERNIANLDAWQKL